MCSWSCKGWSAPCTRLWTQHEQHGRKPQPAYNTWHTSPTGLVSLHCRSNGFCPIHYAAVRGHIEVVQLLQRYQQDLEQRTRSGRTPLELAAAFGQGELLQYLLSKNCAIESVPRPLQPVKVSPLDAYPPATCSCGWS
jgi:hypothetical protein